MEHLDKNADLLTKAPEVRLAEIDEEMQNIQERIQKLEQEKADMIKNLQDQIGEEGTQDILKKVWEQKQTKKF